MHTFNATLTPVGQVMELYAEHQGGALLQAPAGSSGGDLDLIATVSPSTGALIVTLANLNAVGWFPYMVTLTLTGMDSRAGDRVRADGAARVRAAVNASVTTLRSQGFGPTDMFETMLSNITADGDGGLHLVLPPFSVVHLRVA